MIKNEECLLRKKKIQQKHAQFPLCSGAPPPPPRSDNHERDMKDGHSILNLSALTEQLYQRVNRHSFPAMLRKNRIVIPNMQNQHFIQLIRHLKKRALWFMFDIFFIILSLDLKVIVLNTGIFWLLRKCSANFDHLIGEKTRMYFAKSLSDSIMNSYSLLPNITILIMQSTSMALQRI